MHEDPSRGELTPRIGLASFALSVHSFDGPAVIGLQVVLAASLGLSNAVLAYVLAATLIGYVASCAVGGALGDAYGRQRVLRVALTCVIALTLGGALLGNGLVLVLTRVLRGIALGAVLPNAFGAATYQLSGSRRAKVQRIYSGLGIGGFSLGLGGASLGVVSWRAAYAAPALLAALALWLTRYADNELRRPVARWDAWGGGTLMLGLAGVVCAIVETRRAGLRSWQSTGAMVVSAACIAAFVVVERQTASPLVRLSLLRDGRVVRACLFAMALNSGQISYQVATTHYLQTVSGWQIAKVPAAFLPMGAILFLVTPFSNWFEDKLGAARCMVAGSAMTVGAFGNLMILPLRDDPSYWTGVIISVVLAAFGFVLAYPALLSAAGGMSATEEGLILGLIVTSYGIGGGVGSAAAKTESVAAGFGVTLAWPVCGLLVALAMVLADRRPPRGRRLEEDYSESHFR